MPSEVKERRARFLDHIAAPRSSAIDRLLAAVMRPWVTRSNRQLLAGFDDAQRLAAQPWPQKLATSVELDRRFGRSMGARRGLIERQTLPPGYAYVGLSGRAAAHLAARRVVIAAIAVERFRADHGGTPPQVLDALVPQYLRAVPQDPFSGSPLRYRATATEYRLYSVDSDQQDDGGVASGLGSKAERQPAQGQPRDLGIRVELRR
jgi:hypothetical protein